MKEIEYTTTQMKQDYLAWLCDSVDMPNSYSELAQELFERQFPTIIDKDSNRSSDGKMLRRDYISESRIRFVTASDLDDAIGNCTIMEMLVALSKRIAFEMADDYEDPPRYFWEMLRNLGIDNCDDMAFEIGDGAVVDEVLDTFVNRDYEPNGEGGLFPLRSPSCDQRYVEIWYQLSEYLNENYPV